MLNLIRTNTIFFLSFLILWLITFIALAQAEHGAFLLWLNSHANSFLDFVFRWLTHIGDGLFAVFLILVLLFFYRIRYGIGLLLAFASSGILSQLAKRTIAAPRPRSYFLDFESLNLIPGLYYSSSFSFPSGHTATAFAVFTFLALLTRNKALQVFYLLLAALIGISRVYLLQHFLVDVVTGALLGVVCGLASYFVVVKIEKPYINRSGLEIWRTRGNKKA